MWNKMKIWGAVDAQTRTKVCAFVSGNVTDRSVQLRLCSAARTSTHQWQWRRQSTNFRNSSREWSSDSRRIFLCASLCAGSIPVIGFATIQWAEKLPQAEYDKTLVGKIKEFLGLQVHAEAAKKAQHLKLIEVTPSTNDGGHRTLSQQIRSTLAAGLFVLPFTVIGPTILLACVLHPFIFGIKSFFALILFGATWQLIPTYYSKSFLESEFMRVWLTEAAYYFAPFRVVRPEHELDSSKSYIFAWHPHGRLFIGSAFMNGMFRFWFPEISQRHDLFMGVNPLFLYVPLIGNYLRMVGGVSVARDSVHRTLSRGDSICIITGGIEEVLEGTFDDKDVLYLAHRKGFCKMAIDHGSGIVPCFCFGENSLFQHDSPRRLRFWQWVNEYVKVGVISPFFGPYGLPLPYPVPLLIVMGEPLFPAPGETVDQLHTRYVRAVEELYVQHVGMSAQPHKKLVIH